MAVTQYTKMIDNNGELQYIEEDRVERFLGEGWTLFGEQPKPEKKSQKRKGKKDKISADAQVTSKASDEEEKESGDITVGDHTWTEEELNSKPCISCDDEEHSYMECDEDNWTFSEDDFKTAKKEN
tara:strand:+ start:244 stop:621 length:378 start_codon:yes stop_codon:yes gene_type:complete